MVLRCSLLGHDYGEPDVEREREERGSEVVVTVREYEECVRCGERHVVSENTEVTSLTAESNAGTDPDAEPADRPPESDAAEPDDAELVESAATDPTPEPEPTDADAPAATAGPANPDADDVELPTDESGDPVTDDGEILEDEPSPERTRDHGEWPESDDVGPPVDATSEPADWPDDGDELGPDAGEGADPTPAEDDAVVLENDASTDAAGVDGGADPAGVDSGADPASGAAADARSVTADPPAEDRVEADPEPAEGPGTGIERAESAPAPADSGVGPDEDVPTEFYCPRCEYVAAADRGSLRAGDICPDCRKGYLGERERRQ
jgi:hypothetical protein